MSADATSNPTETTAITVRGLSKHFGEHAALHDVQLTVQTGEMVALLGASGSGKSTLLRMINGLTLADDESAGEVTVFGKVLQSSGRLSRDVRTHRAAIASIFQQFNLVDRLPVIFNVLAGSLHRQPLWRSLSRRFHRDDRQAAWAALDRVGIAACAWQRSSTLSGGQQQRAAIARALMQQARIILADEPVASLDPASSQRVMGLLADVNREFGVTVLVSLHQVEHAFAYCPRTIALKHGRIVFDGPTRSLTPDRLRALYGAAEEVPAPAPPEWVAPHDVAWRAV